MTQQIGNYKVIQKLGEGGMGVVYLAEHGVIGRQAAIKLLLPQMSANAEAVTRFFNEARSTARIKHPGIVEILDCGTLANGQAYIVMEFLQGETLGAYVQRHHKLSGEPELVRAVVRQVAAALGAAHARGIVHRDLKPDNVFLASEGGATDVATVKILDFGIAKLVSPGQLAAITTTRELLGTPLYTSPEQCKGAKDLDHRSDIYSLGCIAFELLTATPVFIAESLAELVGAHMFREPPPLTQLEPNVPPAFAQLIHRMLAKVPDQRPQSMAEIVAAIDEQGAPAALRAGSVVLPPALPLSLALPVDQAARPRGVPTVLAGGREPPPAAPPSGNTLSGIASERPDAPAAKRRRALAVAAGAVALVGVALVLALGGKREQPAPPAVARAVPAAPPAPKTVDVDVEDPPPGLTVTVDGKRGRVPLALPLGPQSHTLIFQAAGYEPMTRTLDATKSRTLVLDMKRLAPVAAAPAPAPTPAPKAPPQKKKPGKRGRSTDLFLDL